MTGVIATIPKYQFSSTTGAPLVNGTLTVYVAGSTTPTNTWQDAALSVLNTNPIQLDSRGECVLWLNSSVTYKFVLKNEAGVIQWTQDNISGAARFTDLAASTGSSLVGHIASGTALATTVQAKLREFPSIADYPISGIDDAARFQKLLDENDSVIVVDGDWTINSLVTVPRSNMSIYVRGKLKIGVRRWLLLDAVSNVKIKAKGGQIEFAATVTDNNVGGVGAGIHIRNGSNNNSVSGFAVTTLTSDRTMTNFVVGTLSSRDNHCYKNHLTDIGKPFIVGFADDAAEVDAGNIPTSNWNVSNNTMVTCGVAAYANILTRSKSNSYDRTDPYALTEHTFGNNTFRGLGGTGTTQIFIEYWANGGIIVGNKIHGNAVDTYSHIGISCAKAYDITISDNKLYGAFNYQGVELATCNNCVVDGNSFYNVTSADPNSAAVGVSVAVVGDPISTGNTISKNTFINCKRGVLTGGASTAAPYSDLTVISGNTFSGSTTAGIDNHGRNTQVTGNTFNDATCISVFSGTMNIVGNTLTASSSFAISTDATAGELSIKDNKFYGWGTTGQNGAIRLRNTTTASIVGNAFATDGRTQAGWTFPMTALVKENTAGVVDTTHFVHDNYFTDVQAQMSTSVGVYGAINTGTGRAYHTDMLISTVPNKVLFGSAAPTTGTWAVGDRLINTVTTVGQPKGWRCTVAGTPGTWVSEGNL